MEEKKEERVTETSKKVKLADGKEYVVKPLTLADTKKLVPEIKQLEELRQTGEVNDALIDKMTDIVFNILKRANEGLTREYVEENVEVNSVQEIIVTAMGQRL